MASIIKRNVILTPAEYDGVAQQKGIVTFEILGNQASGFLRCYNLENKENLVFGVKINEQMYKFKLNKGHDYLTFSLGNINNLQFAKISCMLVKVSESKTSTLLIGSTETTSLYSNEILNFLNDGNSEEEQILESKLKKQTELEEKTFDKDGFKSENIEEEKPLKFAFIEEEMPVLNKEKQFENEQNNTQDNDLELNNYIDDLCGEVPQNNNCKNCMYKNYFYCKNSENLSGSTSVKNAESLNFNKNKEQATVLKSDYINSNNEAENIKTQTAFYDSLSGQINTLINNNIHEEVLEEILPNSTFVRIEKENGSYMVLGVINSESGVPEYLCYGHPAKNINDKPFNFDNHFSYFPVSIDDPQGEGYYLSYQSAQNGENVKVTLI